MDKKRINRIGSRLSDGHAHIRDHARYTRRAFLNTLGMAGIGSSMLLGSNPIRLLGNTPLTNALSVSDSDKVLVLIQLKGGNDGLNSIVPYKDGLYYHLRPGLSIAEDKVLKLDDDNGFHPSMLPLRNLFENDRMAVIQNVGYLDQSFSHFRSSDIWVTASEPDEYRTDGWLGRYLSQQNPDFFNDPPESPIAVQVGVTNQLFKSGGNSMSMTLPSNDVLELLTEKGNVVSMDDIPETLYGDEMRFLRQTTNDSFRYADSIKSASSKGRNIASYKDPYGLNSSLSIVARLIDGGLGSKVYHLAMGGFDTHANQAVRHERLLDHLSAALSSFMEDMEKLGLAEKVLVMTFSEFGRTIRENGSNGTDHGSGAPIFLFGSGINGGLYGKQPRLDAPHRKGQPSFGIDYRHVYGEVLKDWFDLPASALPGIVDTDVLNMGVIANVVKTIPDGRDIQIFPNPARSQIKFRSTFGGEVFASIFDVNGRQVLRQRFYNPEVETLIISHLSAGTYVLQLKGKEQASALSFVKQ